MPTVQLVLSWPYRFLRGENGIAGILTGVWSVVQLLLQLPAINATSEQSLSVLRRVKAYRPTLHHEPGVAQQFDGFACLRHKETGMMELIVQFSVDSTIAQLTKAARTHCVLAAFVTFHPVKACS